MSRLIRGAILALMATGLLITQLPAAPAIAQTKRQIAWLTDYGQAMQQARAEGKMLLIYFHAAREHSSFESHSLVDSVVAPRLDRFVWLKLPVDAQVPGQRQRLLHHPAFYHMHGRRGVAIIDYRNVGQRYYGRVVSAFPFRSGKYYTSKAMSVVLDLPPGSITQRTMVFAVRIHPEAPASTRGRRNAVLVGEAEAHSKHQADILLQGHHAWDSRFQRINTKLPSQLVAREVVAESWGGETLVDAAIECVHSWRQSSGHWDAVRTSQPYFGYDIKRGSNGVWYATGIFANRIFGR